MNEIDRALLPGRSAYMPNRASNGAETQIKKDGEGGKERERERERETVK